jgi:DNA-directed RNA polymerase specialized sigma24 family protein
VALQHDLQFADVMAGLASGEQEAARQLYERYIDQLVCLAADKLNRSLGARVEPQSVAHSVFLSFIRRVKGEEYKLDNWNMVYGLLAHITFFKCLERNRYHARQKRDPGEIKPFEEWQTVSVKLGPVDEAVMTELLDKELSKFDDGDRAIIDLFMSGTTKDKIANQVGLSVRSIESVLQEFRENLEALLEAGE